MSNCLVCGEPSRTVTRKQGGGYASMYCSLACRDMEAQKRTDSWRKTPRGQFISQVDNAKRRGVEWLFTFQEWLDWWGSDLERRGRGKGNLCMARKGDTGPYSPSNCYKSTREGNTSDWHRIAKAGIAKLRETARPDSLFVVGLLGFGL